nr:hypothetical protein [Candidatus Electrothrix aestuarii]
MQKIEYAFLKKTIVGALTHYDVPNWKNAPTGWLAVESTGFTPNLSCKKRKPKKARRPVLP